MLFADFIVTLQSNYNRKDMKKGLLYVGMWLAVGVSVVSCDELRSKWGGDAQASPEQTTLEDVAEDFGDAWFNWRYADVQPMVTPSSMQRVRFAASNVTQEDLDAVNNADDKATVIVDGVEIDNDTSAVVRYVVENYMSPKHIGEPPSLVEEYTKEFRFVKRGGKWLADF